MKSHFYPTCGCPADCFALPPAPPRHSALACVLSGSPLAAYNHKATRIEKRYKATGGCMQRKSRCSRTMLVTTHHTEA